MSAQEIIVENYMQALLKAALLLGDLHPSEPIRRIVISGFCHSDHLRILHSTCTIICEPKTVPPKIESDCLSDSSSEYLILYPLSCCKWKP